MKVWVTRTWPGADALAARLTVLGHDPLVDPVLDAAPVEAALDLTDVTGVVFTSGHALARFRDLTPRRDLPAWCVGEATASTARAEGFAEVRAATGDLTGLNALLATQQPPGVLLWPRAETPSGRVAAPGVTVRDVVVYRTVERLTPLADNALARGDLDAVLVQSARAAAVLAPRLSASSIEALCLSPQVAAAVPEGVPLRIAAAPTEDALLALLGNPPARV